jgi:hypothetical protein
LAGCYFYPSHTDAFILMKKAEGKYPLSFNITFVHGDGIIGTLEAITVIEALENSFKIITMVKCKNNFDVISLIQLTKPMFGITDLCCF